LPDLEAAIDLNFSEEKERLKQAAEIAVRERIAKELNLGEDAAGDLEGAAQKKLEKQITKGLRKLFD